ncbi:unnamed protein product, partial [Mesorhabditis belari]|uniref:Uncharacterized protein n=1 Tax=Mesorhabditis belari TaxID=2138241 RepID=A0AAF3FQU3_9BILA
MTLEYQSEGVWLRTQVVGFCAQFIDMVKFATFLTKLSNIAGYQQLVVSDGDSSQEMEEETDGFEQEDFDDDSQSDESDEYISMYPEFGILEDYTAMAVTPQYIELVVAGQTHRFAHGPLVPPPGAGAQKDKWTPIIIPGVMLQDLTGPRGNQQYVNLFPGRPVYSLRKSQIAPQGPRRLPELPPRKMGRVLVKGLILERDTLVAGKQVDLYMEFEDSNRQQEPLQGLRTSELS